MLVISNKLSTSSSSDFKIPVLGARLLSELYSTQSNNIPKLLITIKRSHTFLRIIMYSLS